MVCTAQNDREVSPESISPSLPLTYDDEATRSVVDELETEVETSQSQSLTANITQTQVTGRPAVKDSDMRSRGSSKGSFSLGEYHWTIEASAILLSISSMVAILILLPMYQNEPLSSWLLPVSLNVVISVLGATSRASLAFAISACISQGKWNWYRKRNDSVMVFDRFEEASRGPWGSLRLLWWTKLRHWTALGALSAVVLVGFEPFLQAVVSISGEEIGFSGTANTAAIGRTQNLASGSWNSLGFRNVVVGKERGEQVGYVTLRPVNVEYDFGALSAIWEGFSDLSTAENQKPTFICSTRNCTWPPYASLAVCSACEDISSHVTSFSGNARLNNEVIFSTNYGDQDNMTEYTGYQIQSQNLNITEPNDLISKWSPAETARKAELAAQSTCNPGKTVSFSNLKTLIISFSTLKVSQLYLKNSQKWENSTVKAEECALYFCTNIYRSAVEEGVLREEVLGSYTNRNMDSYRMGGSLTRSRLLNQHIDHSLYIEDEGVAWEKDLQLSVSSDEYLAATGFTQRGDLRLNITRETTYTLLNWFRNEFSRRKKLRNKELIYPDSQSGETQPVVISILGTSTNLTRTFENVAASLSKWMRNRSLQTEPFVGDGKEWVVRIRVSWEFLILPIGALLGGCVFCGLSIWETRDLRLPAWRGSSLATLAHGLDTESRLLLREASDGAQIATRARSLKVRFVDSEGGPEMVHGPKKAKAVSRQV